jgi:hypothetical protein
MVSRRTALHAAGVSLAGLAGCLALPANDSSTRTPTNTPTVVPPDIETPGQDECSAVDVPKPETGEGLPDPRSYPEKPPDDSSDALQSFFGQYESAYAFNKTLVELQEQGVCVTRLHAFPESIHVRGAGGGYLATVQVGGYQTTRDCDEPAPTTTPSETPRTGHVDRAEYFLTDRFLVRNDRVVECWE